jgi:hypothetical protein
MALTLLNCSYKFMIITILILLIYFIIKFIHVIDFNGFSYAHVHTHTEQLYIDNVRKAISI